MKIHPMSPDDKEALMRILKGVPEFKQVEIPVAEEVIDTYLSDPQGSGYYILVAEENGRVRGYVCYGPTPMTMGTWDVYWMAVEREEQGRGIGTALLKAAEAEIREAGGRMTVIETSSVPLYRKTLRFHLRSGYSQVARIPDFYEPGDDKLILQKYLS